MPKTSVRPLRADAQRNYEQILSAAAAVFVERGASGPLEEVARRARVGIGTLYRRFPDRQSLMDAVVLEAVTQTANIATRCMELDDPLAGLIEYLHTTLDLGVSAVIPALLEQVDLESPDMHEQRERGLAALQRMMDDAQSNGSLRAGVTPTDLGVILVRLSRPLPGGIPTDMNTTLAHRHLDIFIDGLRGTAGETSLASPALTFDDLRAARQPVHNERLT